MGEIGNDDGGRGVDVRKIEARFLAPVAETFGSASEKVSKDVLYGLIMTFGMAGVVL